MAWLTAVEDMDTPVLKRELRKQRISFWLAAFNFCTFMAQANVRAYLTFIGDRYGHRQFVHMTLVLVPIWGLCWFAGFLMVIQSLLQSRRATWYGLVALAAHVTPMLVVAACVVAAFWHFFANF